MQSKAQVQTDRPTRYIKQLCEHMGRKIQADWSDGRGRLEFPVGVCELEAGPGTLTLYASAPDEESLDRVAGATGKHLEQFGSREGLVVQWVRSGETSASEEANATS